MVKSKKCPKHPPKFITLTLYKSNQLLELMGNIVPCPTINHANYNIKVHYGSQHMFSCS
jgi:hypothetical protein